MPQLFFFTGENAYAVREERHVWKEQFQAKHGPENCSTMDSKGLIFRMLLDEISAAPFIAEKRLIIVDGVPKLDKEELELLPNAMHPDCILLFVDAHPDKRLTGVKTLLKIATVKEFKAFSESALRAWMTKVISTERSSISSDASQELIRIVGDDQEMLSQEISKLCAYAGKRPITLKDVQLLAVPSGDQEIWHLTNLIAQGRRSEALLYADRLLSRGEDPYGVWSILLWMLRGLVCVTSAVKEGDRNPASIASSFSLPFPTVKNLIGLAGTIKMPALAQTVSWAAAADIDLKTGGYRSTADAPQELVALIDTLIVKCSGLGA